MKLCDLKTALALQEMGYDGDVFYYYNGKGNAASVVDMVLLNVPDPHDIPCPRLDDAAYWLRKKHGLHIYITFMPSGRRFYTHISDMHGYYSSNVYYPDDAADYDTALANAVESAIQIIKNHKK